MTKFSENNRGTVLVIDDRENMLKMMQNLLGERFDVRTEGDGAVAMASFEEEPTDLVVSDIRMPGIDGMEILRRVKEQCPRAEVILMTAYAEVKQAVEALKEGAYDYVVKPFEPEEMILTLEKALERKRLRERAEVLEKQVEDRYGFANIVGQSAAMERVFEMARKASSSDATVLLSGESGTGKEMFARAIHYASERRKGRFVAINCAAIPRDLIESELFGHVKGAFSGATRDKPGLFEQAEGGTLLLDEITELDPGLQSKINRVLQEQEVRRVGDTQDRSIDVRVVAATNRNLQQSIEDGRFRKDLYFRLNVFPIHLPPLREREGDVPLLAEHFLRELTGEDYEDYHLSSDAVRKLLRYSWPGNVRELRNCIKRAVVLTDDGSITEEMLQLEGARLGESAESRVPVELPYKEAMKKMQRQYQREYLVRVLKRCEGNVTQAAEYAEIERESFHRLMRKCDIDRDDVREQIDQ